MDREIRVAQVKLVLGVFLVVLLLYGVSIYGAFTRGDRLAFDLESVSYPTDIVVVMDFRPTPFHTEKLSEHGYYGGRDGDPSRIVITRATRGDVDAIASIPWVDMVEKFP